MIHSMKKTEVAFKLNNDYGYELKASDIRVFNAFEFIAWVDTLGGFKRIRIDRSTGKVTNWL